MPFDGMNGSEDYGDNSALRLTIDIREQTTWLCKIVGKKNPGVEHCGFKGCGKHFIACGVPIALYSSFLFWIDQWLMHLNFLARFNPM